ncbi:MAG TPA: ABC transporter permease [Cyclobacteriaceae bacterium]|nr:ABC transporter permease [Cyclobacteriaceae bacterium]
MKRKTQPPRLAEWLFDKYCGSANVDDLRGDIEEVFYRNVQNKGYLHAASVYWRQVLSLVFSYAIRKRKKNASYHQYASSNPFDMWGNYLKVGFRNLSRHRYFTILNMAGLAIGMSISLLFITLFVSVTDYDEFHVNKKNIYRVITKTNDGRDHAPAPAILGEKLKEEYPGIREVIHIGRGLYSDEPLPKLPVSIFGLYVDPAFLATFTFPLVAGDPRTALTDPRSIVLTEMIAKRIFGENDPMGKQMMLSTGPVQVTGIMKDFPANTHFSFHAIAPYSSIAGQSANMDVEKAWSEIQNNYVYLHLEEGTDISSLQAYLDKTAEDIYKNNPDFKAQFQLQALGDITPGPELDNEIGPQWSYLSFAIAGGLGLLILLPACFNYTNISIARALKRSKEIGLRKTLGGMRRHIFAQFIAETVIVTTFSLIGACAIFFVIRGEFQSMLVHASSLDLSLTWERFFYFLLFAILTGFFAGLFPALHFSRLNPIEAIKNNLPTKFLSGIKLRKALIVFQFTLCLTFILGIVIFHKQYRYAMNFDLGFDEENILNVDLYQANPDVVTNEFSKLPFVQKVSMSSGILGHGIPSTWTSLDGSKDSVEVFQMFVDGNFIGNTGIELLAGKTFEDSKNGETSVIINETLMKRFSFAGPSEALGQVVHVDSLSLKIIGVIKNFHFWQLHAPPGNFFFRSSPEKYRFANVRIVTNDVQGSLQEIESAWQKFANGNLFTARFQSEATEMAFGNYVTLLKIFGFLGLLAVSISCLGLLGMVVYTAESKTKEVGIRKVMGASRWSLAVLLSKGFLKLMLIASLFALPLTLVFNKLLSGLDYYRVAITFFDIALGLLIMFALGVATMASQTWKTASVNPAETLKYE